jgi:hypothetical protein
MKSKHLFGSFIIVLSLAPSQTWAIRSAVETQYVESHLIYLFSDAGPVTPEPSPGAPDAIEVFNNQQVAVPQPDTPCSSGKYVCAEGYEQELDPVERVLLLYSEVGRTN